MLIYRISRRAEPLKDIQQMRSNVPGSMPRAMSGYIHGIIMSLCLIDPSLNIDLDQQACHITHVTPTEIQAQDAPEGLQRIDIVIKVLCSTRCRRPCS